MVLSYPSRTWKHSQVLGEPVVRLNLYVKGWLPLMNHLKLNMDRKRNRKIRLQNLNLN